MINSATEVLASIKTLTAAGDDRKAASDLMSYAKEILVLSNVDRSRDFVEVFYQDFVRDDKLRTGEEASHIVIVLTMTKWCEHKKNMDVRKKLKDALRAHILKVSNESEARTVMSRL